MCNYIIWVLPNYLRINITCKLNTGIENVKVIVQLVTEMGTVMLKNVNTFPCPKVVVGATASQGPP